MAISESLLPEFDQEMAGVRKTLERVPEDKFDWKPHPKSLSMSVLAGHIANLPSVGHADRQPGRARHGARRQADAGAAAAREHRGARGDVRPDVRRGARGDSPARATRS